MNVLMPQLGETVAEGTVAKWHKQVGDKVAVDELLLHDRWGDILVFLATEREILEGPFNDIHEWRYEQVCELIGGGIGSRVTTQQEFEAHLAAALADRSQVHLLNVLLNPADRSPGMVRLARRLGKKLSTDKP